MAQNSLSRSPEVVIMSRSGSVLGKKTVLKSDHFPGCQNRKLLPHIEGAPNFRQISGIPVYGVAIPTVDGIRNVLHMVGATRDGNGRHVLWHNMREEPVIYINGRPFVLREVERPFSNLEYTGIDRERVEAMEERMKEDVLQEAARYSNKIMVSDELDNGQMVDLWEPISAGQVQTPLEVYQELVDEGYNVTYHRVPVTDEKSPKERDFDLLVSNLAPLEQSSAQIFNCQMGRGRTTTGMVVAALLALRRWPLQKEPAAAGARLGRGARGGDLQGAKPLVTEEEEDEQTEAALRRGDYVVIRSLVRVLEGGQESKKMADAVIDRCSAMQNLREAILGYRNAIYKQADERKRQVAMSNFVEYLERYYFLICFAAFLHDRSQDFPTVQGTGSAGAATTDQFQNWMKARPELYSILRRLLRSDPTRALAYRKERDEAGPSAVVLRGVSPPGDEAADEEAEKIQSMVLSRKGEVLGQQTVLKADHCPGCQSDTLKERIEGAPNFREIPGFNVYGVANPRAEGIRSVLERVGARRGGQGRRVVWHNMREEATVYINGSPYVLREAQRPFKNMKEYTGIVRSRVEAMEARLKEDVLAEAQRNGGAVLVTHESSAGAIYHALEHVAPPSAATHFPDEEERFLSVQTPLDIYENLQREGYLVEYERLPITDGRALKNRDLDAIANRLGACDPDTAFVFNCQMGRGRTTTGTVVATLVLLRCMYGTPLSIPRVLERRSSNPLGEGGLAAQPSSAKEAEHPQEQASICRSAPPSIMEDDRRPEKRMRKSDSSESAETEDDQFSLEDLLAVQRIVRLLEMGEPSRKVLDAVIDACAMMQNIREAVLRYRQIFNQQTENAGVRQGALSRGVEYLERYITLIAFTAYLNSPYFVPSGSRWPKKAPATLCLPGTEPGAAEHLKAEAEKCRELGKVNGETAAEGDASLGLWARAPSFDEEPSLRGWGRKLGEGSHQKLSFKDWMRRRPDIRQMKLSMRLRPSRVFTLPDQDLCLPRVSGEGGAGSEGEQEALVMEAVVRSRSGTVLSRSSILKLDNFPRAHLQGPHPAALGEASCGSLPNFFQAPGLPVCSMALPTVEEARLAVRALLGSTPAHSAPLVDSVSHKPSGPTLAVPDPMTVGGISVSGACEVKLVDLREEAAVYIKGQPFVLRELQQPVGPLKHLGIKGTTVALMEQRLKEELLEEASRMGGKILLHKEEVDTDDLAEDCAGHGEEEGPEQPSSDSTVDPDLAKLAGPSLSQAPNTSSTSPVDLVGFWSSLTPEDVLTPAEVYARLLWEEGLSVKYSRVPVTRQREPETRDVDRIQKCMDESPLCVKYLFVSHTGHGAIAYAMAIASLRLMASAGAPAPEAATLCMRCQEGAPGTRQGSDAQPRPDNNSLNGPPFPIPLAAIAPIMNQDASMSVERTLRGIVSPPQNSPSKFGPSQFRQGNGSSGSGAPMLVGSSSRNAFSVADLALARGEYRSVLSLERLLVHGPTCKTRVDELADRLRPVGNILGDTLEYRTMMNSVAGEGAAQMEYKAALKEMALKALKRYCYLILFEAYLLSQMARKGHTLMETNTFTSWVEERPEIHHVFRNLTLN